MSWYNPLSWIDDTDGEDEYYSLSSKREFYAGTMIGLDGVPSGLFNGILSKIAIHGNEETWWYSCLSLDEMSIVGDKMRIGVRAFEGPSTEEPSTRGDMTDD